jgi:hypothetical protein
MRCALQDEFKCRQPYQVGLYLIGWRAFRVARQGGQLPNDTRSYRFPGGSGKIPPARDCSLPQIACDAIPYRRADLILSRISEVNAGSDQIGSRSFADIRDIIRGAIRARKGGRDLGPQMKQWRSYLKGFKNTVELVAETASMLPRSNGC